MFSCLSAPQNPAPSVFASPEIIKPLSNRYLYGPCAAVNVNTKDGFSYSRSEPERQTGWLWASLSMPALMAAPYLPCNV